MRHIPRNFILGLILALASTLSFADFAQGQTLDQAKIVQDKVEPSVVYLQFWTEGQSDEADSPGLGTGFVIPGPQGKKWIVTTSHSLAKTEEGKKIISVKYRMARSQWSGVCKEAIVQEQYDLAMLNPIPALPASIEPLDLYDDAGPLPVQLYAVGSAKGWPIKAERSMQNPDTLTITQWAARLVAKPESFAPLAPDLLLLRHGIPIAPGHSGCPIVTIGGKVIGIQSSALPDADHVGYAIHVKHLQNFNQRSPAKELKNIDIAKWTLDKHMRVTSVSPHLVQPSSAPPNLVKAKVPLTIKLGGIDVEAPFIHHGYVERDAVTVINKYIQDKEWYLVESGGGTRIIRLQQLLNRTRLARISNPTLGLQVLVPEGYGYSVEALPAPGVLLVTFSPPSERKLPPPYDLPVYLWTTLQPGLCVAARDAFASEVKSGKLQLTQAQKEYPTALADKRDKWTGALVAVTVAEQVFEPSMNIQVTNNTNATNSRVLRDNNKVDVCNKLIEGMGVWFRATYTSTLRPLKYVSRIKSREPLVVIAHSRVKPDDGDAFQTPGSVCDDTVCEEFILMSSVSLN